MASARMLLTTLLSLSLLACSKPDADVDKAAEAPEAKADAKAEPAPTGEQPQGDQTPYCDDIVKQQIVEGGAKIGDTLSCRCSDHHFGPVYGSKIFTPDNDLCVAARHQGLVTKEGGSVEFQVAAGCPRYEASAANEVETQDAEARDKSFFFPKTHDGSCPAAAPAAE